jgi:tetratricopeptide (TPR) repeat protein
MKMKMKNLLLLVSILSLFLVACEDEKPVETTEEKPVENHLMKGNEYLLNSDFKQANAEFDLLLKEDSLNTIALYSKGVANEMRGDYHTAIENYTKAIKLNPNFTLAYYKRANSRKLLGDNTSALADLKKSIEIKPEFAVAIVEAASLEAAPKDVDKTIVKMLSNSINQKSDSDILYQFRGYYQYHLGNSEEAIKDFEQALKLNPANVESLYYSGIIYGERKEYPKAIENLSNMIKLDEDSKAAYLYRGIFYFNNEENEKACADFKKAAELGESSAEQYISKFCSK